MKTKTNLTTVISKARLATIAWIVLFTITAKENFAGTRDEMPVELKYIGTTNNQPVFLLNLHNNNAEAFEVTLRSSSGEVLYSERLSGKQLQRKYRLNTEEIDASGITVEVSSKSSNTKVVYAINRKTRVTEDVVVDRL